MFARVHLPIAIVAAAALAVPAFASGTISMPEKQETLPRFSACVARLKAAYEEDRAAIAPRVVAADGTSREVTLETRTKGVAHTGRNKAHYHGRVWYANGRIANHDPQQRAVSHSWDERDLVCEGRTLIINQANGFTLSTFEPITPPTGAAKASPNR